MPRVIHFEIYTDAPETVQPFYRDVLGGNLKSSRAVHSSIGLSGQVTTKTLASMAA